MAINKFILTRELGRLVKWLRILGFDTVYFREDSRSQLVISALREDRIIVTRNQRIPFEPGLRILKIKEDSLNGQLKQLIKDAGIEIDRAGLFSRCIICNSKLEPILKEKVKTKVPEYVFAAHEEFSFCPQCQKIYWQGTHWGNVLEALKGIV